MGAGLLTTIKNKKEMKLGGIPLRESWSKKYVGVDRYDEYISHKRITLSKNKSIIKYILFIPPT